jgi:hypothetical protein
MLARLALVLTLCTALPASAQNLATGAEIKAAIAGNTVQGAMTTGADAYTEFYAEDGAIKAKDYSGRWVIDGDTMCFTYDKPEAECWGAVIQGDMIMWKKDGKDDGMGTILKGNPNKF